jgi:hypothetical protein
MRNVGSATMSDHPELPIDRPKLYPAGSTIGNDNDLSIAQFGPRSLPPQIELGHSAQSTLRPSCRSLNLLTAEA